MKTTMLSRPIANPRRTRLASLADLDLPKAPESETPPAELPTSTANPRRTIVDKLPLG